MGRRASPSPSRGRRTRGAAFQRSGGGGLTGGGGIQRHQAERHPRKELRDMEAQRPGDKEHGDPEREHGDLGRENRETRGEEVNTRGEDTETGREE